MVLLLHGDAESGLAWYGWVPSLARRHRVVRPDMRGFGASTPMPRELPWTLDILIADFVGLMDHLGVDRFHLVGAKIGGTIVRAFAARRPERVASLIVVGTPPPNASPNSMRPSRRTASSRGRATPWPAGSEAIFRRKVWRSKRSEIFRGSGSWALLGAGVAPAVDAQQVAEMRPQPLRPRRVRRLAPLGRTAHLGGGQMVERDIALGPRDEPVG
jgi:pimeloyl-ACP methyl ester carboxylesterase